jgi:hypothetical protein
MTTDEKIISLIHENPEILETALRLLTEQARAASVLPGFALEAQGFCDLPQTG